MYCLIFQVHYSILFTSHLLACLNVYVLLLQMASMDQGLRANAEQDVANGVNAGSGQTNAANGQTNAANGHSNAANGRQDKVWWLPAWGYNPWSDDVSYCHHLFWVIYMFSCKKVCNSCFGT